ncbi:MAG: ABC transporter permease [Chitinophagaceae bacterium]
MWKNYFKTAFRNLRKNKLYTGINIFGLAIGLTACLLIGIYIMHELSYDSFNKNADRIVRVTMEYSQGGTLNTTATTGTKAGPQFSRSFPSIENYVRTFIRSNVVKSGDKMFDEPRILYADSSFFKIFTFPFIAGDATTALDAPDKIVITKTTAEKYFPEVKTQGYAAALDKTLTSGGKDLKVSGVCEDAPQNSQLKFDFATSFYNLGNNVKGETWWTANWITYLLVHDKKDIPQLQSKITAYMNSPEVKADVGAEGNDYLAFHLEPLKKVHLYSSLPGFEPNGSIKFVYLFAIIALLILLIASANYTNLSTAQSSGRSAEIGMRKVLGASKKQVFTQFMSESFLMGFIAAILALILSIILIPLFDQVTGIEFSKDVVLQPIPLLSLLGITIIISILAGLYPALILAGTQVMGILKKGFTFTGGKNWLRKSLIVIQFGISVFLIIYTVIILQQMNFMKSKNLGYDKSHVVVLPIGGKMLENFTNLETAFRETPGVQSITASYDTPEFVGWGDGITATDEKGKHAISLNAMPVDLDFTKTLGMQMLAGRDFQQADFAKQDTTNNAANYHDTYIINETLAKKLGWTPQEAIGRTIEKSVTGEVVGVVKDFNFSSLHDPIGPMLLFLGRDYSRNFIVRINGNDMQGTLGRLENVWKQRVPDRPFNYHFLDDAYDKLYVTEDRSATLFSIAALLAIILACLGLFGLAAFTTLQRTKEIGVRRVLGATAGSIVLLISKNFLQLVAIAILIAAPLAWFAGKNWLQDYSYRIDISLLTFLFAGLAALAIALITVGFQAIRAALLNPVKSLRSE